MPAYYGHNPAVSVGLVQEMSMRAAERLKEWTSRRPVLWVFVSQGIPMLAIAFAFAVAIARTT